jgi:DNA-binding Lrp family transcriptional regulator
MVTGFVLISAASGKENCILEELNKMNEVIYDYILFGEYDLIVKVETKDFNELGSLVVNKIRPLAGVIDTKTLTGMKF